MTRRRGGKRFIPQRHVPRRHVSSHFNAHGRPKRRYASFADGMLALERWGRTGTVYRCEVCRDFHASSRPHGAGGPA